MDIDALRTISEGINRLKRDDNAFVVITHYQRLLDYVKPDFVHIMRDGRIVKTGGPRTGLGARGEGRVDEVANGCGGGRKDGALYAGPVHVHALEIGPAGHRRHVDGLELHAA